MHKSLGKHAGILESRVNYKTNRAETVYNPEKKSDEVILIVEKCDAQQIRNRH